MSRRFAQVIFCDDIRSEIRGKHTHVGVYGTHIYVEDFPASLSRICMHVMAFTDADDPFGKLVLRVRYNDQDLSEHTLPEAQGQTFDPALPGGPQCIRAALMFSPAELGAPGVFAVSVEDENGDEICLTPPLVVARAESPAKE